MAADAACSTSHKTAEAGRLGVRGRCGRFDGIVCDIPLDYAGQTAAGKACAKPGAAPAASTAGIDMGGTAAAAEALQRRSRREDHGRRDEKAQDGEYQHAAAGIPAAA